MHTRMFWFAALTMVTLVVGACERADVAVGRTAPPDVAAPPSDAQRTASGIAWKVLTPGTGTRHPRPSSEVSVLYTGWKADGEEIDSSTDVKNPTTFRLDEVIPGWTESLQLMTEGEKRRFWIPGNLAYDNSNRPGAPKGPLVFDIELIRIGS
jgi:FKBP-type peptidyl-prolyl cis-trans isomerase